MLSLFCLSLGLAACATPEPPESTPGGDVLAVRLSMNEWVVENLMDAGIPDNAHATLTFTEDGAVSGSTGCNRYNGTWTLSGDQLVFGPIASTRRACFGALNDMEQKFLSVLQEPATLSLDQTGLLRLQSANGSIEAR